jgi:pyrimidine operon attenuation protein/uracil phosphoribosyltransferase
MSGFRIADGETVDDLLGTLAGQILAEAGSDLHLVGIRRRGVPLMKRVRSKMEVRIDDEVSSDELVLKRYADDLSVLHDQPELKEDPDLDVDGRRVLLVDDVLFTGRTMWTAVNVVREFGASQVFTATLCSRGGNDVPLSGQFVGLQLDVCKGNVIEVHIPPYEEETEVVLYHEEDLSQ